MINPKKSSCIYIFARQGHLGVLALHELHIRPKMAFHTYCIWFSYTFSWCDCNNNYKLSIRIKYHFNILLYRLYYPSIRTLHPIYFLSSSQIYSNFLSICLYFCLFDYFFSDNFLCLYSNCYFDKYLFSSPLLSIHFIILRFS